MVNDAPIGPTALGIRLRLARLRAGLTCPDVASKVDLSVRQLNDWENGTTPIGDDELDRLARAYGVSAEELRVPPAPSGRAPSPDRPGSAGTVDAAGAQGDVLAPRRSPPRPAAAAPPAAGPGPVTPPPSAAVRAGEPTPAVGVRALGSDPGEWLGAELKVYREAGAAEGEIVAAQRVFNAMQVFARFVEGERLNTDRLVTQLNVMSKFIRQLLRDRGRAV